MSARFTDQVDDEIVAEINITPLTDIFLVLLIIFMISSSAMLENGLQVKLPQAKSSAVANSGNTKPTFITIAKDGSISVNEKVAPEDKAIEGLLRTALLSSSEKTVVIRGDESIFLGKAVQIMDMARAAGAEKIALATQPQGK